MKVITAHYMVTASPAEIEKHAGGIALEQTVEVPRSIIREPRIEREIVGQIRSIEHVAEEGDASVHRVVIDYNAALAGRQLPQLLNLLFGNISIKNNIRLADIVLPEEFIAGFDGPKLGIAGLREMLGVYERPLLSTAIKPQGASVETLAKIAGDFARGGGDLVKDDHNFSEADVQSLVRRAGACHHAVEAANAITGRGCCYLPNICCPADQVEQQVEAMVKLGVRGILIPPLLLGLDVVRKVARDYPLLIMAHPTFTGTFFHDRSHGIMPGVLLGTLMRLAGVDVTVFPNYGGRFGFTKAECSEIALRMQQPMGALKPGWPAPAGGMQFENIPQMAKQYGQDNVLLIGGALLSFSDDLEQSTRTFAKAVAQAFNPREETPAGNGVFQARFGESADTFVSACEWPEATNVTADVAGAQPSASGSAKDSPAHLPARIDTVTTPGPSLQWQGRTPIEYKASQMAGALPFKGVVRHELLGKNDEPMQFDLRYFEVQPGGFTSLEKHQHVHAIIAARGQGVLRVGDQRFALTQMDVGYVSPGEVHQLRNENDDEPFGFFCIVDRKRDRPTAP